MVGLLQRYSTWSNRYGISERTSNGWSCRRVAEMDLIWVEIESIWWIAILGLFVIVRLLFCGSAHSAWLTRSFVQSGWHYLLRLGTAKGKTRAPVGSICHSLGLVWIDKSQKSDHKNYHMIVTKPIGIFNLWGEKYVKVLQTWYICGLTELFTSACTFTGTFYRCMYWYVGLFTS